MIEIALALGIIGFALVAIIGILPAGLNVQRETRQDTIIAQDAPFLLEAIRNGAPPVLTNGVYQVQGGGSGSVTVGRNTSLDFLTNYVEQIWVAQVNGSNLLAYPPEDFTNGTMILGLLSRTNVITTARIRGLSGAATEQGGSNAAVAFRYYMEVEIEPGGFSVASLDPVTSPDTNFNALVLARELSALSLNMWDVRLKFRWPARFSASSAAPGPVGPGRQTYHSLVSASLVVYTNNFITNWFFQPSTYSLNAL